MCCCQIFPSDRQPTYGRALQLHDLGGALTKPSARSRNSTRNMKNKYMCHVVHMCSGGYVNLRREDVDLQSL